MSFRNANMLYHPSLSIWTARKLDKKETQDVVKKNGAVQGAANVHKALLPGCEELDAIRKWRDAFRTWVYLATLPWNDSGWRIRQAAHHMDFMSEVGDRIVEGDLLVDAFMDKYRVAMEEAKFKLNDLWNPEDYPTVHQVRCKFSFAVEVMPLPNAEDFRIVDGLSKKEAEALVKETENATKKRFEASMRDAYDKLYTVVTTMANTLEQYGNKQIKKFNDTLVGNIDDIVSVMPALNIMGDRKLDALCAKARELTAYSCVDLRQNEDTRNAAITEARTLASEFKGLVSASIPAPAEKPKLSLVGKKAAPKAPAEDDDAGEIEWVPVPDARALFSNIDAD